MRQITSIEQCKVGMKVHHPIWGKGEITTIANFGKRSKEVTVRFEHCKHYFYTGTGEGYNRISHLFTEPVFICTRKMDAHKSDLQHPVYVYKPINKDQ